MGSSWKNKLTIGVIALALITVPLLSGAVNNLLQPQTVHAQGEAIIQNTIQVSGRGDIQVQPDIAYITMGVQTVGATAEEAQEANAKKFAALEALLYETYGLAEKDVQTSGFYVNPNYQHKEDGTREITGYTAVHRVTVSYRDMENIGQLLDDASAAGVNNIDGVRFGTEKNEEYQLQAMEKAMENARSKAEAMAGYAGKKLGDVVHISETGSSGPPIVYSNLNMVARESAADMAMSSSVQIGELDVYATVYVTYTFQ